MDGTLQKKLRQAYFVGVVSQHRSLVQWQEELLVIHHSNLAQAMFYQLALAHFGGNRIATFPQPVAVQALIEQVLQTEEDLQDQKLGLSAGGRYKEPDQQQGDDAVKVNETNAVLAKQATACLWDNAAMVEEYFGIRMEIAAKGQSQQGQKDPLQLSSTEVVVTGLPILLEGHSPPPHGLPLFLLRLATEVDWAEERPCFDGVCRELGNYYSQLPTFDSHQDAVRNAHVQHTLFPALSYLLMPSERLLDDIKPLTVLSNLYKVFERC
jgi:DNA mismatch repair protein Mlh1 C-terminus